MVIIHVPINVSHTGKSHKLMVINNATIVPNPMVPGKSAKITLDAELHVCKHLKIYTSHGSMTL